MVEIVTCGRCNKKLRCCFETNGVEEWNKCELTCPDSEYGDCKALRNHPYISNGDYCNECLKRCS